MSSTAQQAVRLSRFARISQVLMASCLGVMAVAVFINVVLRYGFGSGVAASEELSRLLFVWMVFIGAAAAYPAGEHMAFTWRACWPNAPWHLLRSPPSSGCW